MENELDDELEDELDPAPSPVVKERLMARVREERKWRSTGIPGVEARLLSFDRERNYVTTLLRMAPGAVYPRHRHSETEECFVLEGDVQVGDRVFHAGDYERADAGSIHQVTTRSGCTLLILASRDNEML